MLIGPKGSGKTHIGELVDQHTDIAFLSVEPLWLTLKPNEDGWKKVKTFIDAMFRKHDKVMIESLGAGEAFSKFYASLARKYAIKMIRVYANLETCFSRVKTRNAAQHIPVADDKITEYNKIAADVHHNWDLEIDNDSPVADTDIIEAIQSINY